MMKSIRESIGWIGHLMAHSQLDPEAAGDLADVFLGREKERGFGGIQEFITPSTNPEEYKRELQKVMKDIEEVQLSSAVTEDTAF